MSETNGESRLDRIEKILERHAVMLIDQEVRHHDAASRHDAAMDRIDQMIERQILANEAAHERFEAEDQRLLTAQILMNGAMQTTAETLTTLELKMLETTEKLNALIVTVDGIIPRKAAE